MMSMTSCQCHCHLVNAAQLTMVYARTLRQGSTLYVLTITSVTIMPFQLMTGWRGTRVTTLSRCCSRTTAEPLLTMSLLLLLKTIRTAASNTRTRTHARGVGWPSRGVARVEALWRSQVWHELRPRHLGHVRARLCRDTPHGHVCTILRVLLFCVVRCVSARI